MVQLGGGPVKSEFPQGLGARLASGCLEFVARCVAICPLFKRVLKRRRRKKRLNHIQRFVVSFPLMKQQNAETQAPSSGEQPERSSKQPTARERRRGDRRATERRTAIDRLLSVSETQDRRQTERRDDDRPAGATGQ